MKIKRVQNQCEQRKIKYMLVKNQSEERKLKSTETEGKK